jgi:hypothetical protein
LAQTRSAEVDFTTAPTAKRILLADDETTASSIVVEVQTVKATAAFRTWRHK